MQSRKGRCWDCKEVFPRDDLHDVNGILYCNDCKTGAKA